MQYLGIDISKEIFDVALIVDIKNPEKVKQKNFTNDQAGFDNLGKWLSSRASEPVHVAMEATGSYWEALAEHLYDVGILVSVINPSLIKKESQSWALRNKTDELDAKTIARFCLAKQPRFWVAPDPAVRELRDMVRHLGNLQSEKQRHTNRLEARSCQPVEDSLEKMVSVLDEEISMLEKLISKHIDSNHQLKQSAKLLNSIPGIGEKSIGVLLGELMNLTSFAHSKAVAAYAGLSPRRIESGKMKGRSRLSKMGNSRLRRALYFPALTAARYNPIVKAFYERLLEAGKTKMSAICACMRKLLVLVYGVLKNGKSFDPAFKKI